MENNYNLPGKYKMVRAYALTFKKHKIHEIPDVPVTNSIDVAKVLRHIHAYAGTDIVEYFYLLMLNKSNRVHGYAIISQGGFTGTVADPRVIALFSVLSGSTAVVLCHNHPSGSIRPSRADEELTAKIKAALKFFDIIVLDHIIISSADPGDDFEYYSFADEGAL